MLAITEAGMRMIRKALRIAQETRDRPVTLPKVSIQRPRKLSRAKHDSILDSVVRVLKSYSSSKFEYEGPCISGIRSALCLDGWDFPDADRVAREIVEAGLRRIGAVRPTWGEGQPDFTGYSETGRTRCVRCATEIPAERFRYHAEVKYCDDVCQRADRDDRRGEYYQARSLAEWLAECAVRSRQKLLERARNCETCGTHFLTRDSRRKYCSRPCFFHTVTAYPEQPCETCGTMFKPKLGRGKPGRFCSSACSGASRVKPRPEVNCKGCGTLFVSQTVNPPRVYCGPACNPLAEMQAKRHAKFQCDEVTT
jgi:hypothetical protein